MICPPLPSVNKDTLQRVKGGGYGVLGLRQINACRTVAFYESFSMFRIHPKFFFLDAGDTEGIFFKKLWDLIFKDGLFLTPLRTAPCVALHLSYIYQCQQNFFHIFQSVQKRNQDLRLFGWYLYPVWGSRSRRFKHRNPRTMKLIPPLQRVFYDLQRTRLSQLPSHSRQQVVSFPQSSSVSPVELADEREARGGAKSYDSEKAWPSMNYSILSAPL